MFERKIIFWFFIYNSYLHSYVLSERNVLDSAITNQKYSTVKCISDILRKHCPCGCTTTFVNPNRNVDQLIKNLNGVNICHSIIVRSFENRHWFDSKNINIITVDNLLQLSSDMLVLARDTFWNPRAKFIVQVSNLDNLQDVQKVFMIMLQCNMYNVILIRLIENDAMIYAYYPFRNHNCGKHFDEVITLSSCENTSNITNFYPIHTPRELRNCTVRVVASDDVPNFISKSSNFTVLGKYVSGLEQYVLDTTATREGFYIDYKIFNEDESSYGVVLPNRTTTGLLHYIDTDYADLAAGGYILMKNRVELFDFLYDIHWASYKLYTPATQKNLWKRLYKEFDQWTWCLIGCSLLLMIAVCQIIKKLLKDETYSILNTLGYFLSNANAGLSKNLKFRIIIFWWAWFTFFILNFYNTALYSLITAHVHDRPHSFSSSNLKSLPYKPCISNNTRMVFKFAFNQDLPEQEPIHKCTYTDGALHHAASTKKYYAIEMEDTFKLKQYEYIDREGKYMLEAWEFSSRYAIVVYMRRGFPFKDIFQKYATRMYEAGLSKQRLFTIHLKRYSAMKTVMTPFKKTILLDLRLHFCLLLLGYILSAVFFVFEICYNYINQKIK